MNPNHLTKAKKELHKQFPGHFADDYPEQPAAANKKKPVLTGFQAAVLALLFFILLTIWVGLFIFWQVGILDALLDSAIQLTQPR